MQQQQATVYLNKAEKDGNLFIKLYYKYDKEIQHIIENNDWLAYIGDLKAYCCPYSDQNIKLIRDLFEGIAIVNTHYLHARPKIKASEVHFNKETIFHNILEKANKKGSVLLIPDENGLPLKILRAYYKEYKPKVYLFEGQFGGKYPASSNVRNVFAKSLKATGIESRGSLHALRHSFATQLIENGVDVTIVQALLGHRSLKTTEIYLHVTNKQLRKIKSPIDHLEIEII